MLLALSASSHKEQRGVVMAVDLNQVSLVGRLTRDPEGKDVGNGRVVEFSLAVNGSKETVAFFDVSAWDKTGAIIEEYARKGKQVAVTGRLVQDRWEAADGQKRSKVTINANSVQLLGSKDESPTTVATVTSDEVPF